MDLVEKTGEEVEVITVITEDADTGTSQNQYISIIQLENGPEGVICTSVVPRRRHREYSYEEDPIRRMQHRNRLMGILLRTIKELSARVGKQAAVVVADSDISNFSKVFGSQSLWDIIGSSGDLTSDNLEQTITSQIPTRLQLVSARFELPPLVFGGISTPVRQMTQIQLRSFIPLMLKFSLGRCQPGWGVEALRPSWWPRDVPWSNIKSDVRSEDAKNEVSWTRALMQVVVNCYNFHSREDLLPAFTPEDMVVNSTLSAPSLPEPEALPEALPEENNIEYYVYAVQCEEDMDDATQFKDLADDKIEYYVDDAVQSEENMDDSVETKDLAGRKQIVGDVDDAVPSEENMDDAVETKDQAGKKHVVGYIDDAVQSIHLGEGYQIPDYVNDAEIMYDADQAEYQDGEKHIAYDEDNAFHSKEEENLTEYNSDGAIQYEEIMYDAVQAENQDDEKHIAYYEDNAFHSEEENVIEYDSDGTVQYEEIIYDAIQAENQDDEKHIAYYEDNAFHSEEENLIEYDSDGVLQSGEALAKSNYSEKPMEFRFEDNLAISSQSQYQLCDSTQPEESIVKVSSFQSEGDIVYGDQLAICNAGLLSGIEEDSNSMTFVDPMAYDPVEDDTYYEFPEIEEEDMDVDPATAYSPPDRLFLRPITAEDEDLEESSFILEFSRRDENSSDALECQLREE